MGDQTTKLCDFTNVPNTYVLLHGLLLENKIKNSLEKMVHMKNLLMIAMSFIILI
jgi:hypothetical protein